MMKDKWLYKGHMYNVMMGDICPKPGPQSRALCGLVCTLSIVNTTLLN